MNFFDYSCLRAKLKVHQLGMQSNGAIAWEGANFTVILFPSTCDFHHKFGDFSFILLIIIFLIVSFTCSYSNISFNSVLVHFSLFIVLFSFVFVFVFVLVTVDTSCVCQIGYETVEEGLLNMIHLITRNWN